MNGDMASSPCRSMVSSTRSFFMCSPFEYKRADLRPLDDPRRSAHDVSVTDKVTKASKGSFTGKIVILFPDSQRTALMAVTHAINCWLGAGVR